MKDKIFEILLTNTVSLLTFWGLYKLISSTDINEIKHGLYLVPLSILIIYLLIEDIKILKERVIVTQ